MAGRKSSRSSTLLQRVFVSALVVLGLLVSWLVVFRVDPRPARLGGGQPVAARPQSEAGARRP